jgi:hypothetical protein
MATIVARAAREESFYQKMAAGLAVFILFAFGQFAARGFVDVRAMPIVVHAHAIAMTSWLAVLVGQATLAQRFDRVTHRRLGWLSLGLVVAIPPLAIATAITMIRQHAIPPFFTPAFFLSLVAVEAVTFFAMVAAAIVMRRRTDWHRRLMIGSTLLLLEPALGRALPMPLLGAWGEWLAMAVQLGVAALLVRHDLATRARIHRATLVTSGAILFTHVADTLLGITPLVVALTASLTG